MGTGRRAYDLLRSYVNREWERIQGLERSDAERELTDSLDGSKWKSMPQDDQARNDPKTFGGLDSPESRARRILGVGPDAEYSEIRRAYRRLHDRSATANFPAGSTEAKHAADIQKSVQWAYQVLSDGVDVTERRFRSLEIE